MHIALVDALRLALLLACEQGWSCRPCDKARRETCRFEGTDEPWGRIRWCRRGGNAVRHGQGSDTRLAHGHAAYLGHVHKGLEPSNGLHRTPAEHTHVMCILIDARDLFVSQGLRRHGRGERHQALAWVRRGRGGPHPCGLKAGRREARRGHRQDMAGAQERPGRKVFCSRHVAMRALMLS